MPTTILATALPYSLADDAPFHLTVFVTHKLVGGAQLSDHPAAADWVDTLAGCTFGITTSLNPDAPFPLRIVSVADAPAWAAALPGTTPVNSFPEPRLSQETWRTNPASRMSDHAIDLHMAAIMAAPASKPALEGNSAAGALLDTLAELDQEGPLQRLLTEAPQRARRALQVPGRRLRDALATVGPITDPQDQFIPGDEGETPPPPPYQSEVTDTPSPVQVLLDDPDADLRVTAQLDGLIGQDLSADPSLQMLVDAHAMRRYYERPEQPQQSPRAEPDPDAPPTPRPDRPDHDFHARVASFGSTPALLRRLGLAVDVVLDGMDAAGARAALAGATWVSVAVTSDHPDLAVLPTRRTAVEVNGDTFAARSSDAWVGGAVPLGEEGWVVLDTDPDASGLKLDQHARNLARHYASEANGDPDTSAPGTLRATGFAIARKERAAELRARLQQAETLASDDGTRELLLDDLVRGVRLEVWDDQTRQWHSLHRRRVTVVGNPGNVPMLTDEPDVGFLQLSALSRSPDTEEVGYYLHEVVAGWDGWSLSTPRPGRTIVHREPRGPDEPTEAVVTASPDEPITGAHVTTRVEPRSLPRLRYGTSYSFRMLAVDLAGNSVPQVPVERRQPPPHDLAVAAAGDHLDRLRETYSRRDRAGLAAAVRTSMLNQQGPAHPDTVPVPEQLLSGVERIDDNLRLLIAAAVADEAPLTAAQRMLDDVSMSARVLAAAAESPRIRPQLRITPEDFADLAGNDDLQLPVEARLSARAIVTAPRPYLRWEPVPAPVTVPRHALGTGEQSAVLVVRSGLPDAGPSPTSERHLAPPKATQLEAETAGLFDAAIGTGNEAETRRLYAVALAERGTLLDQFIPNLSDARRGADVEQPGITLVDRPGADTGSPHRATLADIRADRGRPIGEGQYVVHDTDALRLPYLPDPFASGVSLVFYEAGDPHALPEPRALQAVAVPYTGTWPSLRPLRIVLEGGETLAARVDGHDVHVTVPAGDQVRAAISSTLETGSLDQFGLWASHLASVADPEDGFTTDEVIASASLMRAAAAGWTWWLTPASDLRLVHAVPAPVRPPALRGLGVLLRPPGRAVAALSGLVEVHGSSTDQLLVTARWTEQVDDPATRAPQTVEKSDVVVRSIVGERERTGVLFLYDFQPFGPLARALGGVGLHRMLQTFADTHYRRVTYVPSGTTRYAEYFDADQVPEPPVGEPVTLDIPSSARPAAPVLVDAVPLLRWEDVEEPDQPFAWRQTRRSGIRVWLERPWFSSGDGELLGVLVFDPEQWARQPDGTWRRERKPQQAPDGATSLWAADPIVQHGGGTANPTVPPLLTTNQLLLDTLEAEVLDATGPQAPLGGAPIGGRDRGWPSGPGSPVTIAAAVPLRDVREQPEVRVLGYQPEYDPDVGRWFVDVAVQETSALWPFLRLALARYQPHSIEGCALSPVIVTDWVQPLPARTLTVGRPDAGHVQVTLSGVVSWLRWDPDFAPDLPGEQLSADSPTGEAKTRASRLQLSRTVRASVQRRADGASDLEWELVSSSTLVAVSVEETGGFRSTWTGTVTLPVGAGTQSGDALGCPGLRRPGDAGSTWRVLVEEHELLNADLSPDGLATVAPRLVYAGEIGL
jgi:hypothetical protein